MFKTLMKNDLTSKIGVLVGTRPGIIKMSPLVFELRERKQDLLLIHAGQHYTRELDKQIHNDMGLPPPHYRIESMEKYELHGEQTAEMLRGIERVLVKEKPRCLLVCGDANTNLAGALAARKLNIEVGHVESGLRSHDWRMPEEHNRVMIDHISEYLFAPTKESVDNLKKENVRGKIVLTGNTIVDVILRNINLAIEKSDILKRFNLSEKEYVLFTVHREENVDNPSILQNILKIIEQVMSVSGSPVVFPVHPRTRKNLVKNGFWNIYLALDGLKLTVPQGYLDFLKLLNSAKFLMTDSGGIQEESCILGVPCVTLRNSTERPESVAVGANIVSGMNPNRVMKAVEYWLSTPRRSWSNPYGDGHAAKRIIDIVLK